MTPEYLKKNKPTLLRMIKALDFGNIVDLKIEGGQLYCAHPMNDCDGVVWFNAKAEGSGFCQMFGG